MTDKTKLLHKMKWENRIKLNRDSRSKRFIQIIGW